MGDNELRAEITETDIPGLFDVVLSDGREFHDLTVGQVASLSAREGWKPPEGTHDE